MSKMTPLEKEIALLRHEANRLRLFGRPIASIALEDKAIALSREAYRVDLSTAYLSSVHRVLAEFITRYPAQLMEALNEIDPRPIYSPPEEVAKWVAGALTQGPGYITGKTWQAILKVVNVNRMQLALMLPMVNDVDFVISLIERSRDAVSG